MTTQQYSREAVEKMMARIAALEAENARLNQAMRGISPAFIALHDELAAKVAALAGALKGLVPGDIAEHPQDYSEDWHEAAQALANLPEAAQRIVAVVEATNRRVNIDQSDINSDDGCRVDIWFQTPEDAADFCEALAALDKGTADAE